MELLDLVNQLESLLHAGTRVPGTHRAMVDTEKILAVVERMRSVVPQDTHDAEEIVKKREEILEQALVEGRRIRQSAEAEAKSLVGKSEIGQTATKEAEEKMAETARRAQRMLSEAEVEAALRRGGADQYAQETLSKLERDLSELLNTVRRGIDNLHTRRGAPH